MCRLEKILMVRSQTQLKVQDIQYLIQNSVFTKTKDVPIEVLFWNEMIDTQ